jgi:cytochrome b
MPKPVRTEPSAALAPVVPIPRGMVHVWDPVVRLFHWGLVLCFGLAWLTSHRSDGLHHVAGYAALTLLAVRLVWGVVGPRYARFAHFVREPGQVRAYLADVAKGREARHLGHNPAGGAMVVALLLGIAATAVTGWMETTGTWFGVRWVEVLHSFLAHGLLVLVAVHVAGVALASYRHRENLVAAMVTGRKRGPGPGTID